MAKGKESKSATDQVRETLIDPAMKAGEALKQGGQKIAENTAAVSRKMIDHAEENTREAFAAMRAAADATSLGDVAKVQAEFLRAQGERSVAQAREIGETIMAFGREVIDAARGKN